jgi:WD40 repeat protein
MTEIWKVIPGYENLYEASSEGRIRSVDRTVRTFSARAGKETLLRRRGKILSLNTGPRGYLLVSLSKDGVVRTRRVNRLVCCAFYGSQPETVLACHNDGNQVNNRSKNLRWDTPSANQADRKLHGTAICGEAIGNSTLTEADVVAIRASRTFRTLQGICVSRTHYYRIKKGEAWAHL